MRLQRDFDEWFVSEYGDGPAAQAIKTAARMAWYAALDSVVPEDTAPEVERIMADLDVLATVVRTGYEPPKSHQWTSEVYRKTAMRAVDLHVVEQIYKHNTSPKPHELKTCPHAAPLVYCDGCKVIPCPLGLDPHEPQRERS